MSKIDVITVKLTCHIPIGPSNRKSLEEAYDTAEGLIAAAGDLGFFTTAPELRHNRVAAPEAAEASPDNSGPRVATCATHDDLPEHLWLKRTAKTEAAE